MLIGMCMLCFNCGRYLANFDSVNGLLHTTSIIGVMLVVQSFALFVTWIPVQTCYNQCTQAHHISSSLLYIPCFAVRLSSRGGVISSVVYYFKVQLPQWALQCSALLHPDFSMCTVKQQGQSGEPLLLL